MSEQTLKGHGSSQGIAIGGVHRLASAAAFRHRRISKNQLEQEIRRFLGASREVQLFLQKTEGRLSRFFAKEQSHILESQRLLLSDPAFKETIKKTIREKGINTEWALELALEYFQNTFSERRAEDLKAVLSKTLNTLHSKSPIEEVKQLKHNCILVAESLTPAMVAHLPRQRVLGFITQTGGQNSHTTILARSLKIPAVCGVNISPNLFLPGKKIILDGFEQKIVVGPNKKELKKYKELSAKHELLENLLLQSALAPARTLDGKKISIEANIELPEEIPFLLKHGAEGIGLFRTESLFWDSSHPPSEAAQVRCYKRLLSKMKGKPVTLRTLDVSGEEWLQTEANNPALGLRGIRFGLKEILLLKTQIRAMLKASPKGFLKILLPMVSAVEEVKTFKELLKETQRELKREKISFQEKIPLGVMLEVPAACMILDLLAKEVDFFAIGTNDLLQYTLALDRTNEQVASFYSPTHPAILRMLSRIVQETKKLKKPILICGELAGDPEFLPLLIGMGMNHFSMNAQSIPKAKEIIRSLSAKQCTGQLKKLRA